LSLYLLLPMPARGSSPARYPGSTPSRGRRALPGTLKQRESGREREREGERGRGSRERAEETEREREREGEREREREKGKNFQSERKNDVRASSRPLKLTQHLEKPSTEPPCCFVLRYVLCLLYHDDSLPFGRRDHRGDPALWHQVRRESWGLEAQGDREEH